MYRASTYRAFLPPALTRKRKSRLFICTDTLATRIEFSAPFGTTRARAAGVYFETLNTSRATRKIYFVKAKKEIVLCGGALGSPQLLLLRCVCCCPIRQPKQVQISNSGVGPKDHLSSKGVGVVRDMPGVGSNMVNQVIISVYTYANPFYCASKITSDYPSCTKFLCTTPCTNSKQVRGRLSSNFSSISLRDMVSSPCLLCRLQSSSVLDFSTTTSASTRATLRSWTPRCRKTFQTSRSCLSHTIALTYPSTTRASSLS